MPDTPTIDFTMRLFGHPEVRLHGAPLPRLRTRKGLWFLTLLVLRAGSEVERHWLAGTLWPNSPDVTALANLRSVLMDLRRALGEEGHRICAPTTRTLKLDLSDAYVDVLEFDAAIQRGDMIALQRAASLYRGPFLDGCPEEWAFQERRHREQAYLAALEALAAQALAAGNPSLAQYHLQQAVALDPWRETAERGLMQALAAGGNPTAALAAYRDLRLRLRRELNAEPDADTQALYRQIRADLGARTRSAGTPETGFLPLRTRSSLTLMQPLSRTSAIPAAASPSVTAVPQRLSNLPAPTTSFLGREQELAILRERLCREEVRLITLTGPGGTGKTRLGLEVATKVSDRFSDGVVMVPLAPLRDPGLVAATIAAVLSVRETGSRPILAELKEYLRDRQMLLLLDNFEHLVTAAPVVAELLQSCPRLKVLVTSRELLRVQGEHLYPVPPLALPDPKHHPPLETLPQYAAIALFIHRAQQANPGFRVTREDASAVVEICRRLDGLPLAIELAAAHCRCLSSQALLRRLESRLKLLTEGPRDLPERQQTLRSTISWSYELLSAEERKLFRRLSIFVGSCTPEAVQCVCNVSGDLTIDVTRSLMSLADRSLLCHSESAERELRFAFLETIREFAWERLENCGELATMRLAHARYFTDFVESSEGMGVHLERRLDRLETEHDNLRAVLTWATEPGPEAERSQRVELGLRLGGALDEFWTVRSHFEEARERLSALLAVAGPKLRTLARARVLRAAANYALGVGDHSLARALLEESLAIRRELNDGRGTADSLYYLGLLESRQGRSIQARRLFEESLRVARSIGARGSQAAALLQLAGMARDEGDYRTAHALLEQSLALRREIGDPWMLANALQAIGKLATAEGRFQEAIDHLEESLTLMRQLGSEAGRAVSLEHLGLAYLEKGEMVQAEALLQECVALQLELGRKPAVAHGLCYLATVAAAKDRTRRAARLLGAADAVFADLADAGFLGRCPKDMRTEAHVRAFLGEEVFVDEWNHGRRLTPDQAVIHDGEELTDT